MIEKDETLFSEVKKDIVEHLGNGKLYEVVVKDYTDDPENGKLGMVLEASPDTVARQAVRMADALVEKLKKNLKENKFVP